MCGRYVSPEEGEIERFWHIGRHDNKPFTRRFNVSPTSIIPILAWTAPPARSGSSMRWGLIPTWWKIETAAHDTTPLEEAATKPMWKGPLAKSRCLIPAVGWYEWKQIERTDPATGEIIKAKQPHFFHLADDQLFAFAGVMAMWKPANDIEWQASCAFLTREAVGPAAAIHDRMPVVLSRDSESGWLDPGITDPAQAMAVALRGGVTEVQHHPVSNRVNVARNDDESLIQALNIGP
jgi:putative SOS response-associated peptidase YedK